VYLVLVDHEPDTLTNEQALLCLKLVEIHAG
jgi:hypothetical protein